MRKLRNSNTLKFFIFSFLVFCGFLSFGQFDSTDSSLAPVKKEFSAAKHSFLDFSAISKRIHFRLTFKKKKEPLIYSSEYLENKIGYRKPASFLVSSSLTYSRIPENYFISPVIDSASIDPSLLHKPFLRNQHSSFWRKAGRGEVLIGGIELIGMVGLMLMPKEVTKWEPDWMKIAGQNLKEAFTLAPVWDKDDWAFNYIGHPVAGSYYYNAVRSQNAKWWESFLFATFQSCVWEYVIEGTAERPSIQDLIITPIGGMIMGEPIHILTMNMRKNGFRFMEKVFVLVLNPMYVFNNGFGPRHNPVRVKKF